MLFLNLKKHFFLFLIALTGFSFAQTHSDWSYNLGVYEVNIRQYTAAGTFAAFETHLDRLKDMGVGILWFMPINPIGVKNRIGTLGSYYSVKDYKDINPEFGDLDDFKSLVKTAHEKGFYVIIDWVANHTSWDNNLTITHPEWYTKDSQGNFVPPAGTNWSDVIDLDYSQQGLRDYMTGAMKFWITEADIDGFRCDAASMVPLDFWSSAITELKAAKPGIIMLAEADGKEYQTAGFDMTFAWGLYGFGNGVLPNIINGSYNANFLASYLRGELSNYQSDHSRMYFTSNHDENSWYGTVYERFDGAAENFAAITLTMNGIPLIYSGQEAGLNKRLQFFEKDQISWSSFPLENFYSTLLHLKKENQALWSGDSGGTAVRVLTDNNPDIFAFVREKNNDKIFALFNLTNLEKTFTPTEDQFQGTYVNVFSGDTITFETGTSETLSGWGYKIYKKIQTATGIENEKSQVMDFSLDQNYPNPFNPATTIHYSIPVAALSFVEAHQLTHVTLKIYDILGNEVSTLVNENQSAGNYEVTFNASGLSSGVYFYKLQTSSGFTATKKMILLR